MINFPINYQLPDGTEVEVNLSADKKKYIFDLKKANGQADSFTWTPSQNVTDADRRAPNDPESIDKHRHEALHIFWRHMN